MQSNEGSFQFLPPKCILQSGLEKETERENAPHLRRNKSLRVDSFLNDSCLFFPLLKRMTFFFKSHSVFLTANQSIKLPIPIYTNISIYTNLSGRQDDSGKHDITGFESKGNKQFRIKQIIKHQFALISHDIFYRNQYVHLFYDQITKTI